ncbi:YlxR family protein [Williamsia herbipolensis]|uniref:YlxR family protein n=1 Tax=Williamsia herbipolensis TaxID=1603258 RepID=A0AAU4K348_9NOCA|nr:YlxR family protein [Williamsia herbipolensis]
MVEKALTTTGPVRTCIGCRTRAAAADLVRVVAAVEQGAPIVTIDRTSTMPGRGAWLHHNPDCVRAAVRRKAFGPALRVPGLTADADRLEREMAESAWPEREVGDGWITTVGTSRSHR